MTEGAVTGANAAPAYAAVLCAGLAALLLGGRDTELRRARLLFADGAGTTSGRVRLPGARERWAIEARRRWKALPGGQPGPELWCLPVGCLVALLGASLLPLPAAIVAVPLVRRWLRSRERGRARDSTAARVIELCAGVAGELRAGRQPDEALRIAVSGTLGTAEGTVTAAARFGGDVPAALRKAARQPGAEGLLGVAACWQVAADSGAGLAAGLERVADALRAERAQGEELEAQLAGTRATAVMLALLPLVGLLMGSALGAEPLRVLLHTPAGWMCLLVGGALEYAGLVWTARVVRAASGRRGAGTG
ncbi:type II secretion system F family protein [Streptomyces sp. NPDC002055]|uniref:type II secretion system F family protein n=1 Tax=Streptomyces sp. NPDC002055 TaxID=3154534 RepID=UPI0033196D6F